MTRSLTGEGDRGVGCAKLGWISGSEFLNCNVRQVSGVVGGALTGCLMGGGQGEEAQDGGEVMAGIYVRGAEDSLLKVLDEALPCAAMRLSAECYGWGEGQR